MVYTCFGLIIYSLCNAGLFIAYIALTSNSGIIVTSETTTTTLRNLGDPNTLMAIAGILITAAFVARRIKGALLIGILATALLGWILAAVFLLRFVFLALEIGA